MDLQRRPSGFVLLPLATVALCLSCTGSDGTSAQGTGGGSPSGTGGVPGTGGTTATGGNTATGGTKATTATGGTTAIAGTTGTGGTTTPGTGGTADPGGTTGTAGAAVGGDGGKAAGTGGTSGGTGGAGTEGGSAGSSTTGGTPGTGGSGTAGTAGSNGTAGSGTTGKSAGCGTPTELESGRASIDVDGTMREYILLLPEDYDPNQPYRLIFGWHPWGGSAQQIENGGYFGLEDVIDGQAILVAPEGQEFGDGGLGWGNEGGEDIAFLHAMVDRFGAELCIDLDRMFSTGFSFGAMFSFTLACTENSMMRAIAPEAGNPTTSGPCEDSDRSVATMAFIGTEDSLLSGHRQAVQIFVERNGCTEQTMPVTPSWCDGLAANFEPCSCVEYQGCNPGYPVIECEYNADHQFAPNAGQTMWDFFSQF